MELLFANIAAYYIVSIAFFVVFGSQRDVLRVWCFWRKDETTTKSATTDSGTLILEDPVIPRRKRSPPDTRETHEVRMHQGAHPFSFSLRAHAAVKTCAGYRYFGTDRLDRLGGLCHATGVPPRSIRRITRRKHPNGMGRFEMMPIMLICFYKFYFLISIYSRWVTASGMFTRCNNEGVFELVSILTTITIITSVGCW